jgi:hypothetical protein
MTCMFLMACDAPRVDERHGIGVMSFLESENEVG